MKDGATSEVEYAGEVTCSTETNNKWLIDGNDVITKGSCVTSGEFYGYGSINFSYVFARLSAVEIVTWKGLRIFGHCHMTVVA